MASSANKSQESRTQFPSETMSGEFDPVSSSNFKNQKHSWPSVPLSPQLRYSLSRKQPRIPVSPPASSSFSPSPITVASIEKGSYYKVPARWFPDNRVWSRDFYLSRKSPLLKKMIHQRVLDRVNEKETKEEMGRYRSAAILLDRSPHDRWFTLPIQTPIRLENADLPRLDALFEDEKEASRIAYVNLPVKTTRYSLKLFGDHPPGPHYDGLPFPWVTNTTGTNFLDPWCLNLEEFPGHVECPICGEIWSLRYTFPERFDMVGIQLGPIGERINEEGEEVLRASQFSCKCDGNENPVRPIISDHPHKINWMFLFLGFGIGFCTVDQLKYYCKQRSLLPISESDTKNKLLVTVFDDLCEQIFSRRAEEFKDQKVPLSPQLRYALSRKQPRIPASPPASGSFSPSPIIAASIENGYYFEVSACSRPDIRVWSRNLYLSRNSLLKKMFHRRIQARRYDDEGGAVDSEWLIRKLMLRAAILATFPIQLPRGLLNHAEPSSIAYANELQGEYIRYALKLFGDYTPYDGVPFPWVKNTTGTEFHDLRSFILPYPDMATGHVECPICGKIWGLVLSLPKRLNKIEADARLDKASKEIKEWGDEALQSGYFTCTCDGNENPVRPIISDDLNKINWMFLFLGFGIGYCTIDQLKYYCMQRKLPISESDNKNKILLTVFHDLCQQIFLRRFGDLELEEEEETVK